MCMCACVCMSMCICGCVRMCMLRRGGVNRYSEGLGKYSHLGFESQPCSTRGGHACAGACSDQERGYIFLRPSLAIACYATCRKWASGPARG